MNNVIGGNTSLAEVRQWSCVGSRLNWNLPKCDAEAGHCPRAFCMFMTGEAIEFGRDGCGLEAPALQPLECKYSCLV